MQHKLSTVWGENIDVNNILQEHPRPNMTRSSYINLNGYWDYAFTCTASVPCKYDGKILVPFSPEAPLSGVNRQLKPNEYLWYKRHFSLPKEILSDSRRLLLHFGAVDQFALVYINGTAAGKHSGGYLPFSFDISELVVKGENTITVMVRDLSDTSYHSRGKQKLKAGGMFYTAQSGIWQTVWLEAVPEHYIEDIRLTPLYDSSELELSILMNECENEFQAEAHITIFDGDTVFREYGFSCTDTVRLPMPGYKAWAPEHPFLYTYTLNVGNDTVNGYFAMRKFSTGYDANGIPRLFLNNRPYFHNGLLDQGYWPDGLYTAPTDEALCHDIKKCRELGFNMLRKHAKIEPLRWYYHCDRLGVLVWQDIVNGGSHYNMLLVAALPNIIPRFAQKIRDNKYGLLSRKSSSSRKEYYRELINTVKLLYNFPCIAMWVPFNEGWGQFDSHDAVRRIHAVDKTRTIDHASGWFDQNDGDVKSLHIYFSRIKFKPDKRVTVLSEFGGYSYLVRRHSCCKHIYGYKKFHDPASLTAAFEQLYTSEIIPSISKGLSAIVYTQLSDIENEVNGLLTYDRKVIKMNIDVVNRINTLTHYCE